MSRLFALGTFPLFASLLVLMSPVSAQVSEMAGFNERMKKMELTIAQRTGNRPAQIAAYNALERSLNQEMGRAFDRVMTRMKPSQRAKMTDSQHLWSQHRDNEYRWMDQAHGPVKPNSQAHLRVVELRNLLMNARVIQLYSYLDTLPTAGSASSTAIQTTPSKTIDNNALKVATIYGFSLGDGACFLDLRDDKRKTFTEVANSAFCQRERELLDKKVSLSYKLGVVSGATCAVESVDCGENNMLILVNDAKPIRPKRTSQ